MSSYQILTRMPPDGRQALFCFFTSFFVFFSSYFAGELLGYPSEFQTLRYWGPALHFCLGYFVLRYSYKGNDFEVSIRAAFLGAAFATGCYLATSTDGRQSLGLYMMVLSFFHFSEYASVALMNPSTLNVDSFMLNHSMQYGLAAVSSWIEWLVEYNLFYGMKTVFWLSYLGLAMCVIGEMLRKAAMFTATTNFTHIVSYTKQPNHRLIQHGVYSWFRHPSYVGWFYWAIGTQILLLNPICTLIYAAASWFFFNERVYGEEITLITFFGREYRTYQKRVPTGLPFIEGFIYDDM